MIFRRSIIASLFVTTLWITPALSQNLPALYEVVDVAHDDVLNIRKTPRASATIIAQLSFDARDIEIVAISQDELWGLTNAVEISGWVSMRYLKNQPNTNWHQAGTPLTCFGTEPFWTLELDPTSQKATLRTPDDPPDTAGIQQLWISAPDYEPEKLLYFESSHLFWARLKRSRCDDGMSDRSFGISVDLSLHRPLPIERHPLEPPSYIVSGCCSVSR